MPEPMRSVGIVLDERRAAVAVVDLSGKEVAFARLPLTPSFGDELQALVRRGGSGANPRVGLELYGEQLDLGHETNSLLEGVSKLAGLNLAVLEDKRKVLVDEVPKEMRGMLPSPGESARVIFPGMASAFAHFLTGRKGGTHEAARMLAEIGLSKGKYLYCRSLGTVQSGGDVAQFLRNPPEFGSPVMSAGDMYTLKATEHTRVGAKPGDVLLTYELGKKQYGYLDRINALKMTLLHTCREYGVSLYCSRGSGALAALLNEVYDAHGVQRPGPRGLRRRLQSIGSWFRRGRGHAEDEGEENPSDEDVVWSPAVCVLKPGPPRLGDTDGR